MNPYRHKVSRDAHHGAVAEHLRRIGYEVIDLSHVGGGMPDLLCKKRNDDAAVFVEVKVPGSNGKWYADQLQWIAMTTHKVIVAYNPEQAAHALRERRYIRQAAKDALAALLAVEPREFYQPSKVEPLLMK